MLLHQKLQQILAKTSTVTKILVALAFLLVLALVVHYSSLGQVPLFSLLVLLGFHLDELFSFASLLLSAYVLGMAFLNHNKEVGWFHLMAIQLFWPPFFTLATLFHLLKNRSFGLTERLEGIFSRPGALFLVSFIFFIEVFILLALAFYYRQKLFSSILTKTEIQEEVESSSLNREDSQKVEQKSAHFDEARTESEELLTIDDDIRHDPFFDDENEKLDDENEKYELGDDDDTEINTPLEQPLPLTEAHDSSTVLNWDRMRGNSQKKQQNSFLDEEDPITQEFETIFSEQKHLSPEEPTRRVMLPTQSQREDYRNYNLEAAHLLKKHSSHQTLVKDETIEHNSLVLEETLREFNIEARVVGIKKGPVVTLYEISPAPGVKLSRIVALADNIALVLACGSVRIVAPIPGKNAVGVEVPNPRRQIVGFDELVQSQDFIQSNDELPIALGKDISGDLQIVDLAKTPHLLIAGATGSGKSVMVNSLISSLLFKKSPNEVRLLLVDPKIVELKFFNDIPHLLTPVITEPKRALLAAQWCLSEMERRYTLLDMLGVRDIKGFNTKVIKKKIDTPTLPYIVFIIDEFADLMATSGKDLEGIIARLAAMSRAVGIHLVLATQRPSIDVITGLIKANFPSRIAFMVASKTDSRIILDQTGAENLLGKGDMLFSSAWEPFPKRIQAAYLSEEEVENIVREVKKLGKPNYITDEIFIEEDDVLESTESALDDPLWKKAVEIVTSSRKASASYLQRRMSIGYNRAARLIEEMERQGIVGPQNGSKPREIIASLASLNAGSSGYDG